MTSNLLGLVRRELRDELQIALSRAFNKQQPALTAPLSLRLEGTPHRVVISVCPQAGEEERLALVLFLEEEEVAGTRARTTAAAEGAARTSEAEAPPATELEQEVRRLQQRMQVKSEAYEQASAELRLADTELQTLSEEFSVTSEELETSREELQSANEELRAVNEELNQKVEEISRAHDDLENLMAATEVATLFLDRELQIRRFTQNTKALFNIRARDRGRPVEHLTHNLAYDTLVQDAQQVLRELAARLTLAEHEERARVAQILHDDLQQQLYALEIQLSFLEQSSDDLVREEMPLIQEMLERAVSVTRQLSVDLSPPILEGEGLAEAIRWLANQMEEQYGLAIAVRAEPAGASFVVPALDRRVLLLQMVRELLFNVVKHTDEPRATVRLRTAHSPELGRAYRVDVLDEGPGFDLEAVLAAETATRGRGLWHMRERLHLIGGRLEVAPTPMAGTRVTIIAPCGETDAEEE